MRIWNFQISDPIDDIGIASFPSWSSGTLFYFFSFLGCLLLLFWTTKEIRKFWLHVILDFIFRLSFFIFVGEDLAFDVAEKVFFPANSCSGLDLNLSLIDMLLKFIWPIDLHAKKNKHSVLCLK